MYMCCKEMNYLQSVFNFCLRFASLPMFTLLWLSALYLLFRELLKGFQHLFLIEFFSVIYSIQHGGKCFICEEDLYLIHCILLSDISVFSAILCFNIIRFYLCEIIFIYVKPICILICYLAIFSAWPCFIIFV